MKLKRIDTIAFIAAIIMVVGIACIPAVGKMVLLEEFFTATLLLIVGIWLFYRLKLACKAGIRKKSIMCTSVLVIIFTLIAVFNYKDIILDLKQGEKIITLQNCTTEKNIGYTSIVTGKYYLRGVDETGKNYRFRATRDIYENASFTDSLTIVCYEYNRRIISY